MELREVRTFILAAEKKSFSKVADILYTSQPTVSKMIASLEHELGQQLFIRDRNNLELTDFGREFLPYAEKLIHAEENIQVFLHAKEGKPKTFMTLSIAGTTGSLPSGGLMRLVSRAVSGFCSENPEIHIAVQLQSDRDQMELIRQGRADLALCPAAKFGDNTAQYNDLARCPLMEYHNCLVYSPRLGTPGSLKELLELAGVVSFIQDLVSQDLVLMLKQVPEIQLLHQPALNWYELLARAASNYSVSLVPEVLVPTATACGLMSMPLTGEEYQSQLLLYTAQGNGHSAEIRSFRNYLEKLQQNA